jgi:predicted nucleotidyltransferase
MRPAMASRSTTLDPALAERERVLRILRAHESDIRAQGVTRLLMFGSMARADAGPDSDVDLLADIDKSVKFSLIDLVGLQDFLADLIGRKVDVGTSLANARPRIRQRIETDAVEVF